MSEISESSEFDGIADGRYDTHNLQSFMAQQQYLCSIFAPNHYAQIPIYCNCPSSHHEGPLFSFFRNPEAAAAYLTKGENPTTKKARSDHVSDYCEEFEKLFNGQLDLATPNDHFGELNEWSRPI